MSNIEGIAPDSLEAQALAELQAEGNEVGEAQPIPDDGEVKEQAVEVKEPKTPKTPEVETEEEPEPNRTPTMVEAWKLKVAEDQKGTAEKQVAELEAKIEELSKQSRPITETERRYR